MKKQPGFQMTTLSLVSAGILGLASCSKNITNSPQTQLLSEEKAASELVTNQSSTTAFSSSQILGDYSLRGSRTKYRGQANQNGDNITVIYDYFGEKTIETSRADKALTCGYGEPNLTSLGWKYIIRYNPVNKKILLSPNDTMMAAIKPNSFETLAAVYDPVYHSFTFQTRYTDTDGNENEVIDILNKE